MSDLIDRQQAIDTIAEFLYYPNNWDGMRAGFDLSGWRWEIESILSELPSAQPELRWIPVNKELPKKDGEYLVAVGGEATFSDVDTAWFYYGHWIHQFGCTVKVIAWMPLPEPYREERTEE